MCLAVPGRITAMDKAWATVDIMGVESIVSILLIDKPELGDCILVHAGCAIQKINEAYLAYLQEVFSELLDEKV